MRLLFVEKIVKYLVMYVSNRCEYVKNNNKNIARLKPPVYFLRENHGNAFVIFFEAESPVKKPEHFMIPRFRHLDQKNLKPLLSYMRLLRHAWLCRNFSFFRKERGLRAPCCSECLHLIHWVFGIL